MKEKKISEEAQEKFKKLIATAKRQGVVKTHVQAFQEVPVNKEKHRGNSNYFCN